MPGFGAISPCAMRDTIVSEIDGCDWNRPPAGAGRPTSSGFPTVSRSSVWATGWRIRHGTWTAAHGRMTWSAGLPSIRFGMIQLPVRTESSVRAAWCDRSVAMSSALLPTPTTSTFLPANAAGSS